MKAKKKPSKAAKSGSVKIDPTALRQAKTICASNDMTIYDYVTEAVNEKNKDEKRKFVWG